MDGEMIRRRDGKVIVPLNTLVEKQPRNPPDMQISADGVKSGGRTEKRVFIALSLFEIILQHTKHGMADAHTSSV
jgi:hypothetical protein